MSSEPTCLLPSWLRTALMRASKIQDPIEKQRAIDRVTEFARRNCPEKFKHEDTLYADRSRQ